MLVDLHVASRPASPDALSSAAEMIQAAARVKVQGVALTERGILRCCDAMNDLRVVGEHNSVRVFSGAFVVTDASDALVYGVEPRWTDLLLPGPVSVMALIDWVHDGGGAVVASCLFRDRPWRTHEVLAGQCDWWLRKMDAIEVCWSTDRVDDDHVREVARRLSKPLLKTSGARYHRQVGNFAQELDGDVGTDAELVAAILDQSRP